MDFLVKLIEVKETKRQDARTDLNANCTHVAHDFWLFEGDVEALHEGIDIEVIGEEAIEGYGDMSGMDLKRMLIDVYNVDKCFVY